VHRSDTAHNDLPVMVKANPEATGKITSNKRFLQLTPPTNKVSDKLGVYSKSPKVADALLHPQTSIIVFLLAKMVYTPTLSIDV